MDHRHEGSSEDEREANGKKRHRDREEKVTEKVKQHGRRKRRRKHESSDSDSSVFASSPSSSAQFSTSDESSDGERRRKDTKKRKDRKRSHHRSDKEKSRGKSSDKKKRRRRRRSHSDTDSDDEDDIEREKRRRLLKEAKKVLKRHKLQEKLAAKELQASGKEIEKISAEDYFLKSKEFATWLKEDRGIFFSDLSSEETHKIFETFVETWNAGRLNLKYYEGIKQAPRTSHNWAIKKGPEDSLMIDEEEQYAMAKKTEKYERKKFQKEHENLLDEILPKATGRERLMEKKAIRREQARARDDSPELMKERDVMGGGGDFQERLAREKARREKRQSEKAAVYNEKLSAFEEKETAAMDQLRALVNVAGGKITIAKRSD